LVSSLLPSVLVLGSQLSRKALWMDKMLSESLALYSVRLALLGLGSTGVPGIFEWTRAQVPIPTTPHFGVGGKIFRPPTTMNYHHWSSYLDT